MTSRICRWRGVALERVDKSQEATQKCAYQNFEALRRRATRKAEFRIAAGMQSAQVSSPPLPASSYPRRLALLAMRRPRRETLVLLSRRECCEIDSHRVFLAS